MRVFIPTYRGRDGKTHKSPNFHIVFDDHTGAERRVVAFDTAAGKARSESLGNKLVKLAADAALRQPLDAATIAWVSTMREDLRESLAGWGLLGERAMLSALPLWRHLLAFARNMKTGGSTRKHRRLTLARVVRMVRGIGARHAGDIDLETVQTFRQALRDGATIGTGKRARRVKLSRTSCNHHSCALGTFCGFMARTGRAAYNPMDNLRSIKVDGPRAKDRRAFRPDELVNLIVSTCGQPTHHKMSGRARATVYALAAETGLRASEIQALRRQQIDLGDHPSVTLDDYATKNRKGGTVPLPASLVPILREELEGKAGDALAFPMVRAGKTGRMIGKDLDAAGIVRKDGAGRVADFHALRHTRGVWLCKYSRHSPRDVQALMRLASLSMVDNYTRSYLMDDGNEGGIPDLGAAFPPIVDDPQAQAVTMTATGTDGPQSACATLAPNVSEVGTTWDNGPIRFDLGAAGAAGMNDAESPENKAFPAGLAIIDGGDGVQEVTPVNKAAAGGQPAATQERWESS